MVDLPLGEDMKPGIRTREVTGRRRIDVRVIRQGREGQRIRRSEECALSGWEVARREGVRGQEAQSLGHGGLEEAAVWGMEVSMCGKDLAGSEEGGEEFVLEANVVGS